EINILTSSPRRIYNLQKFLPQLLPQGFEKIDFSPVRGNVQTRVRKLLEGSASGLVVAKAALDRLLDPSLSEEFQETQDFLKNSLKELSWMVLPISLNPPAAAQGALAIEICEGREDLKEILKSIHCEATFQAVNHEREMLKNWGGGCHQKIGVCVLPRSYGTLTSAQGQRDTGELIDRWELTSTESSSLLQGEFFPTEAKSSLWFDRSKIAISNDYKKFNAHWVSKAEAFPENIQLTSDDLIWTSGVKTWATLASRGCWVNGSSESLGEREDERLSPLDQQSRRWCKWTHEGGEENLEREAIKTYKLTPKKVPPLISETTEHFFWMSGSSFREALRHYPWLVNKKNWSGPGLTSEALLKEIKNRQGSGSVHIALSFEQWQKSFISSKGQK
ncbi:hydroxymethylbilane synthase, partial [bacterium]|nr:hydroxymethylbilane synthase [bacterium]